MGYLRRLWNRFVPASPRDREAAAQGVDAEGRGASVLDESYKKKIEVEKAIYKDMLNVNELPEIFHYWSNKYLGPMFREYGFANSDELFAKYLVESARRCSAKHPVFISVGVGNCDTEVRVAKLIRAAGLTDFVIECLDINPHMLERGKELARQEGVLENLAFIEGDFNNWTAPRTYTGVIANQSLHHVLNLEGLFEQIKKSLDPRGYFITHDMIGRWQAKRLATWCRRKTA